MTSYDAILFDFDGVLADTEPIHFACWAEVVKPYLQLDWKTYRTFCIGLTDQALVRFLAGRTSPAVPFEELWKQCPRKRQLFLERALADPPVPPETAALVRSLAEYKLAVVTSSAALEVAPVLEKAGILDCFGAFVWAEDVRRHKPAPDPYLLAASRLEAKRPLVVEDSEAGVKSGRAAGFAVLRIDHAAQMPSRVRSALKG